MTDQLYLDGLLSPLDHTFSLSGWPTMGDLDEYGLVSFAHKLASWLEYGAVTFDFLTRSHAKEAMRKPVPPLPALRDVETQPTEGSHLERIRKGPSPFFCIRPISRSFA